MSQRLEIDPPSADAPPDAPGGLIDIEVDRGPFNSPLVRFIWRIGRVFAFILMFWIMIFLPGSGLGALCVIAAGLFAARAFAAAERERLLQDLARDPAGAIAAFFNNPALYTPHWRSLLFALIRAIGRDHQGRAFRVCRPAARKAIAPIEVAFAARPLDDNDASFHELAAALDLQNAATRERYGAHWRRWRDWLIVGAFAGALIAARRWPNDYTALAAVTTGVVFGLWALSLARLAFWRLMQPEDFAGPGELIPLNATWLIAPGSVVFRWPEGGAYAVRVISRERYGLFTYRLDELGDGWTAIITDGETRLVRALSATECHILLSAWLSPLPPPEESDFSDWTTAADSRMAGQA